MSDDDTRDLIHNAVAGDALARDELFDRHRSRLQRIVAVRLKGRMQRRIDPSDILQEVYLEADRRLDDYSRRRPCGFFVWLRLITGEKLAFAFRHHRGALMRDVGREVELDASGTPLVDLPSLAESLQGSVTSPSGVAMRNEQDAILHQALQAMPAADRDILVLRHLEQLSNEETAEILQLNASTASTRYVRALRRLRDKLEQYPQFSE